ncbi:MAG: CYTH domain-containing protein [Paludibacteraceae bacterium]|nr:CYTH domain-containing protein [Paludibacteraceae bacterium]
MNHKNIEIERKYKVLDDSFKRLATEHHHLRQGYLSLNDRNSIRVRIADDEAFLTVKSAPQSNGFAHFEWERPLSVEEAENLFPLVVSGCIDKVRWIVPMEDGLICEVDEFLGDNQGLLMAEVELESEDQLFVKPAFLGEEVTFNRHYYNSYLSLHPYTTWPLSDK